MGQSISKQLEEMNSPLWATQQLPGSTNWGEEKTQKTLKKTEFY